MRTSACIARATLMGRFSASPPSTSSRPSNSTGANTPGADMLARMAIARSPLSMQHGLAGLQIGRHRAKWRGQQVEIRAVAERQGELAQRLLQFLPLNEALRQQDFAVLQAQRQAHQKISVVLFAPECQVAARRRIAKRLLPIERAHGRVDLRAVMPLAYKPPTMAPMLVPAMQSMGIFRSSRTLRTPICAMPRAPPPDSTRQIRGRTGGSASARMDVARDPRRPQRSPPRAPKPSQAVR